MKKRVAIIGTNGIPANYGGFETLVEYIATYLGGDFDIIVYCSGKMQSNKKDFYKGVKLRYINLNANGWQGVFYDFLSVLFSIKTCDKVLILGCSASIFQPFFIFFKSKFIINLGGLDWQRSKWNYPTRKFLKLSERLGVSIAGHVIADNIGIKNYLSSEYGVESSVIAYGGDQVFRVEKSLSDKLKYPFLDKPYAFSLARIQSDNNIELLCNSFAFGSVIPLVLVGNWNNSTYGQKLRVRFSENSNIILIDAIYDQNELNLLRTNCQIYLHGHSAGGTNPALVEAMSLSLPVFAYDNIYNRNTTHNRAKYFSNIEQLRSLIVDLDSSELKVISEEMYRIASKEYRWEKICDEYAKIFNK